MKGKTVPVATSYGDAIRDAFHYLLSNYRECFVIGQGLWSLGTWAIR